MRAFELGNELGWERSRVSHHLARMVERGLVRRERGETDQRDAFVVLPSKGRGAIAASAPLHAYKVRRRLVELVTAHQRRGLNAVAHRALEKLADDDATGRGRWEAT